MLRVACVLKTGGDFLPEHVAALREGVRRHLRRTPYRFACFTDSPWVEADEVLPLKMGWPGWWSKLEMFDGRLSGPVLYFDLDTVIVGSLDDLAIGHRFTVLRNFYYPSKIGSGMMAWREDLRSLHRRFSQAPKRFIKEFKTPQRWGDQGFINKFSPVPPGIWQDVHPGKVVSFKLECLSRGRVPSGASVVCFHGKPRPWDLDRTTRSWFGKSDASPVHP